VAEDGSEAVRDAMARAGNWFMCRIGFVETFRAVALTAGPRATRALHEEWPAFGVVEVDQRLVEGAAELAVEHGLRSLDALHLASALALPDEDLAVATWDLRLHRAVRQEGMAVLPSALS
jgi:predicted nucleic acid-binding protein